MAIRRISLLKGYDNFTPFKRQFSCENDMYRLKNEHKAPGQIAMVLLISGGQGITAIKFVIEVSEKNRDKGKCRLLTE